VPSVDRRQLRPIEHRDLIRLGPPRDGGYVVPDAMVRRSAVLLSLGMKQDWSFERAFVAINERVRVIGVDPSVTPRLFAAQIVASVVRYAGSAIARPRRARKHLATLRNSADYFSFFRGRHQHVRKAVTAADSASEITLGTLLHAAPAGAPYPVFLKMDIEGAEYAVVPDIVRFRHLINCVVAEFHHLGRKPAVFNQAIAQLLEHFRIVHVHGNNYSAYDAGNDFPTAVEITLVNSDLLDTAAGPATRAYPRPEIDFPNAPGRPDYSLRFD
jgi:hypothetical protein